MQDHKECIALLEPYRLPPLDELVNCLEKGETEVLEKWVTRGGSVNHHFTAQMPEGRAQVPLLVYAAMKGQDTIVEWLLIHGADPDQHITGDPQPTDADGHTPLIRACIQGHATVVRRLLRAGATLGKCSAKGTPLCRSPRSTDTRIASVSSRITYSPSPKRVACRSRHARARRLTLAGAVERISLAEQEGADAPDAQAKAAELLGELETACGVHARC